VTPGAPPPQDLAATAFKGWGELTMAWLAAAERVWTTILEWAYDECAYTGVNQTTAYAQVDPSANLQGEFHRATDPQKAVLAPTCVTVGRTTDEALATGAPPSTTTLAAGEPAVLVVTIRPSPAVPTGGYCGRVVDVATGAVVADALYVYVATTA
jgi:hypothetical protein